ncbi:anti-sigma regulatory factor [Phaeobacter sp. HF9A]|uniref:anti-sigma regulatory factor n=1 Tax=Phaeobacter sp. HF9A TaxID=2721561 RepID=UPI00143083FC|nr:anti-sigma regulatory factor [Phaeobacter sp. HF9A]NIZ15533.1 anti-sigma regulatory factor [Phaeobacter sp. HF9A]
MQHPPDVLVQAIRYDTDVISARQLGRKRAEELGFSRPDQALVATAISELARNIVVYADQGEIELATIHQPDRVGIKITAKDRGPGIADLESALADGFSTGNSLGLGLPGTRRIVDEFDITSSPGLGVIVTVVKWSRR